MNIAILSAARKVWLVRAFQRAVAAHGGGRVYATDLDPQAAALQVADVAVVAPRSDGALFGRWLLDWCLRERIELVVPTRDEELPVLAPLAEDFLSHGVRLVVGSPAAIAACQDKREFARRCGELGLATPRMIETPGCSFPVFIKPRFGKGGRGTVRIDTGEELAARGWDAENEILQEFIEAPEYTIDVFVDWAGRAVSAVVRERVRIIAGESAVARTVRDEVLAAAAAGLVLGLGLRGPATVQAFEERGRILFIEVNPRFGGGAALGFESGCPTPEWLVRLARGEPLPEGAGRYEAGVWLYRYGEDFYRRDSAERAAPYGLLLPEGRWTDGAYALVPLREQDVFAIKEWRNAQLDVLRQSRPLSDADQRRYFETVVRTTFTAARPEQILFSYLVGDRCIGYGGFVHLDWAAQRAELSFLVDPALAADAGRYDEVFSRYIGLVQRIAFVRLGLQRLWTETYDIRPRHVAVLERSGFRQEGRWRRHVRIGDTWVDSVLHGCLKEDYDTRR